jgi:glycosyltransferase involved in cell wall biosynthesis
MFLLEAMASGVPVVQPRRGAFTEIVEKTGGGVLVEPDNPEALADGFYRLWQDRSQLATLADAAFTNVRAHYTVQRSADRQLEVYEALHRGGVRGVLAGGVGREPRATPRKNTPPPPPGHTQISVK